MITGHSPFHDLSHFRVGQMVLNGERPLHPTAAECLFELTDGMWLLIEDCWAQVADLRPSISEVHTRLLSIFRG
jgi:hypothetical protein